MKAGDLVKLGEKYYPEYKGLFGMLIKKKAASGPGLKEMWQVMVDGHIHPFYIPSDDIDVVGFDEDKMTGGRL